MVDHGHAHAYQTHVNSVDSMDITRTSVGMPMRTLELRAESASSTSSSCVSNSEQDTCQKPVSSKTFTVPVILGVILPVLGALVVFFVLHRRHVKKQRIEDANDRHASMDFGLGDVSRSGKDKKKLAISTSDINMREKSSLHGKQQSMDMSLDSPYLLPPEMQNSRESLHSLSRTLHQGEDPYRPVTALGDAASIRSASRFGGDNASIYTTSSNGPSRLQNLRPVESNGPLSRTSQLRAPGQSTLTSYASSASAIDRVEEPPRLAAEPTPPPEVHISRSTTPNELGEKEAAIVLTKPVVLDVPQSTIKRDSSVSNATAFRDSHLYLGAFVDSHEEVATQSRPTHHSQSVQPDALQIDPSQPVAPRPPRNESIPALRIATNTTPQTASHANAQEFNQFTEPETTVFSPSISLHEMESSTARPVLAAGQGDSKRISMGFRPLPPEEFMETDDPELRANRIRSFYKEYFDETKAGQRSHYYEDYDQNYLGDAGYYGPSRNNFIMPYAAPVTRRAMTPPPRSSRLPAAPHMVHGSMGGSITLQMSPGPFQHPRGNRAFSHSFGARGRPVLRKPLPPPSDLNSLPTPSKLRDDSFAFMSVTDFAPPPTYRDRVAGRSQSPLGERRPYSPSVAAYTPTASSFDDLAAMPSPHLLQQSGTFTGLDFAPPRRFKGADTMSDSGSIRSERSGISAMHHQAIRNGAYRVSRIPPAVVFTKDDLATTLKPQWDMRETSSIRDY